MNQFMWRSVLLGEVLPFKYGKNLPASKRIRSGGYNVVSSAGIVDTHCEAVTSGPAIVIGRKGTIGSLTYCKEPVWPTDTAFYTLGTDDCGVRFGYYLLQLLPLSHMNNDSAVPGLNRSDAESVIVQLPPVSVQQDIVSVLGALDDKIAVNNQILFTSDALIREIYENLPKSSSFVLRDICENVRTTVGHRSIDLDRMLVGLEHIDSRLMWLSRSADSGSAGSAKSAFQKNDVLFGKLRPYFHKVCIAPSDGYCSTDVLVLRANNPQYAGLLLAVASSDPVVSAAVQNSNGTRMPRAKWEDISNCAIPDPLNVLTEALTELVNLIVEKCTQVAQENQILARTRDELLPLLMSGKISVREAEEAVVEVGVEKREGEDNVQ